MPALPERPSFEQLQKQAKDLRKSDQAASLAAAQAAIAHRYGFASWAELKHHVEQPFEHLAQDLIAACSGDAAALGRLNKAYGNAFTRASNPFNAEMLRAKVGYTGELTVSGARHFIARQQGFATWAKLIARPRRYSIDWNERTIEPGPALTAKDWDAIAAVMLEHGLTGVTARGRMTDAGLKRLARLDHVTRLDLDGSVQLTDAGLAHLARFPRLQDLDIGGWKGSLTDRGLEVLSQLPELRQFKSCWQQNVSDAGLARLEHCRHLESVNLMGTPSGDGALKALAAKTNLRKLTTGSRVTDAGLKLFHQFPVFRKWQGGERKYGLMGAGVEPSQLVLDGPFTDQGLASLAGLDGLFGLTFFWHCPNFTSAGLASLANLPNLGFLGCQDAHCDDEAMRHIGALPGLRMLMGQGAVATDAGFAALARSKTIEYIWGRDCPNLHDRGFLALAEMPALRGLAVSLKNVSDEALAKLPEFPALRELMPMDVPDRGFRHVGRCEQLEHLWCMYCRDTGDAATANLAGLTRLKTYYAGATRITDKSLEILARLPSLERLEFWQCLGITDAGVAHLAGLPRLREIEFGGAPGVTREACETLFSSQVRVSYWS